jgi:Zn-dependent protease with chaperone function
MFYAYIAAVAVAFSPTLSARHLDIALRVAGEGRPHCESFDREGKVGPCLPVFSFRRSGAINAFRLSEHITFTTGTTSRLNDDEFALLAGHEIAHLYLDHKGNSRKNEIAADRLGAELACKAGFDPANGSTVFRFARNNRYHPEASARQEEVLSIICP